MRPWTWVWVVVAAACGDAGPSGGAAEPAAEVAPEVAGRVGDLEILRPRTPKPAAGTVASLYFVVRNTGTGPDTLVELSSPSAESVTLHRTLTSDGMARMSAAGPLHVGPGQDLVLEPGGLHAMLMGVATPLTVGDSVQVTLRFARAGALAVAVPIVTYADLEGDASGGGPGSAPEGEGGGP